MTRCKNTLTGLAVALVLVGSPASAQWKQLAQGDGYQSPDGIVRAYSEPQPPSKVLSVATAFTGLPYVWAGHDPTLGFDCSGYIYEVLRLNGYAVPRMADEQFQVTERVAHEDLQPGDLVFFTTYLPGPSHAGFYLGDGDFIHASSAAEGVVVSQMKEGYYRERFLGGGRPQGWQSESEKAVAKVVEPAAEVTEVVVVEMLDAAPGVEPADLEIDAGPFSRNRRPQPVRVSVVPEHDTPEEAVLEKWTLMLGETMAIAGLQVDNLFSAFTSGWGAKRAE